MSVEQTVSRRPARRFLRTEAAAKYLGVSRSYLEKRRVAGDGPVFVRFGKVIVYAVDELDRYADARRRTSTSDTRGAIAP